MQIVNIVDTLYRKNFGIWNAALATSDILNKKFGVKSFIIFPDNKHNIYSKNELYAAHEIIIKNTNINNIENIIRKYSFDTTDTLICTHGCWQYPTKWGHEFAKRNFKWIYTPHGMLEPWSMKQKAVLKKIYFNFLEHKYALNAALVRAVSSVEAVNLSKYFDNIELIPNSVQIGDTKTKNFSDQLNFLFIGRLHYKKGVVNLVKAWLNSKLFKNDKYSLTIAGPDHGELRKILKLTKGKKIYENLQYIGPVYGNDKIKLLENSHFFLLPSYSEGFPTSVVEAASYGLIPLISEYCNFPEIFNVDLAFDTGTHYLSIKSTIEFIARSDPDVLAHISERAKAFIAEKYSVDIIAGLQYKIYSEILNKNLR